MVQNGHRSENRAHGIPNHYYTDEQVLAQENKHIFRRTWMLVGREDQLRNGGDYLTCEIGGEPIVVTRDHEGQLHAMYNVCAHRGMRLAEGCGNYRRLYCPYHGWTYDMSGQLRGVPFDKHLPALDKATVRLQPVQVATWGGFIFVNLDLEAETLARFLARMPERWEAYHADWEGLREVKRTTYDEPFNWKIFMENSVDYYHVPFIHQETLELPPVIENVASGHHFMLTTDTPEAQFTRYFDFLYPNIYFHISPSKILMMRATPVTAGATHVDIVFYQTDEQAEEYPINDPTKHRDMAQIMNEDFSICRVLQQQAASGAYRILYTAHDLEEGVDHFDKMVLAALHPEQNFVTTLGE